MLHTGRERRSKVEEEVSTELELELLLPVDERQQLSQTRLAACELCPSLHASPAIGFGTLSSSPLLSPPAVPFGGIVLTLEQLGGLSVLRLLAAASLEIRSPCSDHTSHSGLLD
jgi:hypothetical protein